SGLYPARNFRGNEVSTARVSGWDILITSAHADGTDSAAHFMKIEGTHEIKAPREVVYQAITDPQTLQRCIPGCQSLEQTEENTYIATMKAGVGSVKGTFKGNVRLEDMQAPTHYRMTVDGKGAPGFVKGTGIFNLEERNGGTAIAYEGEMKV